jgi:Phosphate transport regulator (distant homolog of PhoU)
MGISRFIRFLLPSENKFLPLLRAQLDDILAASDLLIQLTQTPAHEDRKPIAAEIKKLESHCDRLTEQILDELNNNFITPFDREDIHALSSDFDDLLDLINGSAKRVILYKPQEMSSSMTELAEHIKESALCIQVAVNELDKVKRDPSVVKTQCRKLHELENSADDVYENFLIASFENPDDAIELMKKVEIIQLLESATDAAYRVSEVFRTIIVKYA